MIQFNLLPDVKLEYIRTRRMKHTVVLAASAVAALALVVFVLLFVVVNVVQKQHLSNLNRDIQTSLATLEQVPDLDKVLTVQNQLSRLTELHNQNPVASRLYTYLIQVTPAEASISQVDVDFIENTMSISGSANSLVTVNKFVDTLKFTEYEVDGVKTRAFSEVVLASFGIGGEQSQGDSVTYKIDFKYDPLIFDTTKSGTLIVPNIISTRSITEKPSDLFQQLPEAQTNFPVGQ